MLRVITACISQYVLVCFKNKVFNFLINRCVALFVIEPSVLQVLIEKYDYINV